MDIILASKSPRRHELLSMLGIAFTVKTVSAPEPAPQQGRSVEDNLRAIVAAKGLPVAEENPDAAVIAADTVVVLDGEYFGKPKDSDEAKRMLRKLSGRTHEVHTGVAVYARGRVEHVSVCSRVTFRELPGGEIDAYVATGEPLDKAGAYGIQGGGAALIRRIEGDYYNVMGLPVGALRALLFNLEIG